MGRVQPEACLLAGLHEKIKLCENNKKQLLSYIEKIKNKCLSREISYSEYEALLHQKQDGKTIQQWLDFYDSCIENCEKKKKTFNAAPTPYKLFIENNGAIDDKISINIQEGS